MFSQFYIGVSTHNANYVVSMPNFPWFLNCWGLVITILSAFKMKWVKMNTKIICLDMDTWQKENMYAKIKVRFFAIAGKNKNKTFSLF